MQIPEFDGTFSFLNFFKQSFYFSIDGPNCAGKTTLLKYITEDLKSNNIKYHTVEEPRKHGYVRKNIVEAKKQKRKYSDQEVMDRFMKERLYDVLRYILFMTFKKTVPGSRHVSATYVYQGELGDVPISEITRRYQKILSHPIVKWFKFKEKSFQFVLQIDEPTALARQNNRVENKEAKPDHLEKKTADELRAYGKKYFDDQIFVDGRGTPEENKVMLAKAFYDEAIRRYSRGQIR